MQKKGYHLGPGSFPSTLLTGYLGQKSTGRTDTRIEIEFVDHLRGDIVFSPYLPATAAITARVKSTTGTVPNGTFTWRIDPLGDLALEIIGNGQKQVVFHFKGLPRRNDQFGRHTISVNYRSADGLCSAEAKRTIRLFYPAFAFNHPSERSRSVKTPNWFYYWKQTPAARPHGEYVRLLYGDRSLCNCYLKNTVACYKTGSYAKLLYLCDFSRKEYGGNMRLTYPLLDRTRQPSLLGWRTTHYIDSFAVALIHEFQHYLDETRWNLNQTEAQIRAHDRDQDGMPDAAEEALRFDPEKYQTYRPVYRQNNGTTTLLDVGGDEEWLAYEAMRKYRIGSYNRFDWGCPGAQIDDQLCQDWVP